MNPTLRARLTRLYDTAVYEVAFPDGWKVFHVGAHGPRTDPFVLITAYDPAGAQTSAAENQAANERLARTLHSRGWHVLEALGRSPDGSHVEPSFAVFGIPLAEALEVAREFDQAAVFVWDGARARIAWCDVEPGVPPT